MPHVQKQAWRMILFILSFHYTFKTNLAGYIVGEMISTYMMTQYSLCTVSL